MLTATLLAQGGFALTVVHWAIIAIVIAGVIGIVFVAAKQAGVAIPGFVITIFWILVCCIVAIVAIKLLAGML